MKHCIKCAEELEDSAKFCSRCGVKQGQPKKSAPKSGPVPKKKKPTQSIRESIEKTNKSSPKKKNVKSNPKTTVKPAKGSAVKSKKRIISLSYKEKLDLIYSKLPQDNCGECGCKNCYQFAMMAASPKNNTEIGDCPYSD